MHAAPHKTAITHNELAYLHFEVLKRPAHSPDLAHLDYCLKKHFKGRKFLSTEEATLAVGR
jgi:hypothetical protein